MPGTFIDSWTNMPGGQPDDEPGGDQPGRRRQLQEAVQGDGGIADQAGYSRPMGDGGHRPLSVARVGADDGALIVAGAEGGLGEDGHA